MKNYFSIGLPNPIIFIFSFSLLIPSKVAHLKAEYLLQELEIDNSTKTEEDNSVIPSNPFELMEIIRRQNSMNNATDPSDAIDNALKSFNSMEEN